MPDGKRAGVGVMILNSDHEVLLGFHIETQQWRMPGGWNEPNERMRETAIREVKEETGLDVRYKFTNDDMWGETDICLYIGYFINLKEKPEVYNPECNKFREWRWFPLSKIPKPLFSPTEEILNEYCNRTVQDWEYVT